MVFARVVVEGLGLDEAVNSWWAWIVASGCEIEDVVLAGDDCVASFAAVAGTIALAAGEDALVWIGDWALSLWGIWLEADCEISLFGAAGIWDAEASCEAAPAVLILSD